MVACHFLPGVRGWEGLGGGGGAVGPGGGGGAGGPGGGGGAGGPGGGGGAGGPESGGTGGAWSSCSSPESTVTRPPPGRGDPWLSECTPIMCISVPEVRNFKTTWRELGLHIQVAKSWAGPGNEADTEYINVIVCCTSTQLHVGTYLQLQVPWLDLPTVPVLPVPSSTSLQLYDVETGADIIYFS